jgi:hypothetical protein
MLQSIMEELPKSKPPPAGPINFDRLVAQQGILQSQTLIPSLRFSKAAMESMTRGGIELSMIQCWNERSSISILMNSKVEKEWLASARKWLASNEDSISCEECYIAKESVPDGEPSPEEWAYGQGSGSDHAVGFTIIDVETEDGQKGVAVISVMGNSWEGLRVFIESVHLSYEDAIASIKQYAYIMD